MSRLNRPYKSLEARPIVKWSGDSWIKRTRNKTLRVFEIEIAQPTYALLPPSPSVSPTLSAHLNALEVIPILSLSPLPRTSSPPLRSPSPPPRSSSSFSDALTEWIFPDIPPLTLDSSVISSRGTPSPMNSSDSVEFLEEIPPSPRSYFRIQESDSLFRSRWNPAWNYRPISPLFLYSGIYSGFRLTLI